MAAKTSARKKAGIKKTTTAEAPKAAAKKTKRKAAAKKATAKTPSRSKAAAKKKPAASAARPPARKTRAKKAPAKKPAITTADVNLGHIFSLRPRVNTAFRPEDFRTAKHRLREESFVSLEAATRAVVEQAHELGRERPRYTAKRA